MRKPKWIYRLERPGPLVPDTSTTSGSWVDGSKSRKTITDHYTLSDLERLRDSGNVLVKYLAIQYYLNKEGGNHVFVKDTCLEHEVVNIEELFNGKKVTKGKEAKVGVHT